MSAFLVSRTLPPDYRATAQLFLTPASSPTGFQDVVLGQNLARSYVQLATAEVVLRPVMDGVGMSDLEQFRKRVLISQVRDTSVIEVSFRDSDPRRAADVANAIADSFIAQSRTLASALQGGTVSELDEQISAAQEDIRALDEQIGKLRLELAQIPDPRQTPSPVEQQAKFLQLVQLESSRGSRQQTLAQLLSTRDSMRLAATRSENTISLWQRATPPAEPESPRLLLNTALGALVGGLLAFLAVAAITYLDDRIEDLDVVRSRLGITPIGAVPLANKAALLQGKLFMDQDPKSPEAEAFRSIRESIRFANVDHRPRVIVVTSALPQEGKSIVAGNLALAFAQAGTPTVLVDADLRRPALHRLFRIGVDQGLTTVLADELSTEVVRQFRVGPNLAVIPAGPLPPDPAEILSSGEMGALVEMLAGQAPDGVVILDTSPLLMFADAIALTNKVDGCVLVIDATRTHARSAQRAVEALRRVHAPMLGAVLNKVAARSLPYYGPEETTKETARA
ncbi:MAG: polysaccharide biosynthesis tyrosine autokinase [Chloroflexota bacterium]|nr:polysaccharide biosynthesis tyrosine autokinase [Chloroflexota bacterium]